MTLRSPIISVLGHVDAGKTSLMDMIRGGTKVQVNEAGGITQSISCSFIPSDIIKPHIDMLEGKFKTEVTIPGLLMIDTPGHQSFDIMRERGSSLCDIAIVVIGLHDGIKSQTIESINMLRNKRVPFIIAMTKLDMLDNYNKSNQTSLQKALKLQSKETINYMESYIEDLKYDLSKIDITAEFYHKNKKPNSIYSIVPVSSRTKEGLSDILGLMVYIAQNMMMNKLSINNNFDCTIMNCLENDNMWVIDAILKNGNINIGDKYAVAGEEGEKIISIRNIYIYKLNNVENVQSILASAGVRLICSNAEGTYTGVKLHPINNNEENAMMMARNEMNDYWNNYKLKDEGVVIMAPTFGELDAMYKTFQEKKIPIRQMLVGIIKDKHIKRILPTIMKMENLEYRTICYFGETDNLVLDETITLLQNKVIFQLIDSWILLKETCIKKRKEDLINSIKNQFKTGRIVFPCELKILSEFIFMKGGTGYIIMGVKVVNGVLYKGTPLICNNIILGNVIGIEKDKKQVDKADRDEEICIKIDNKGKYSYGKHFDDSHTIYSNMTGESVQKLSTIKDQLTRNDINLIMSLVKILKIQIK